MEVNGLDEVHHHLDGQVMDLAFQPGVPYAMPVLVASALFLGLAFPVVWSVLMGEIALAVYAFVFWLHLCVLPFVAWWARLRPRGRRRARLHLSPLRLTVTGELDPSGAIGRRTVELVHPVSIDALDAGKVVVELDGRFVSIDAFDLTFQDGSGNRVVLGRVTCRQEEIAELRARLAEFAAYQTRRQASGEAAVPEEIERLLERVPVPPRARERPPAPIVDA